MATLILATKLYIPPPPPKAVLRPRLIEWLNEGLHHKLTLIAAPAVLSERHITAGTVPRFELDEWRAFGITAGITGRSGDFDLGLFTQGAAGAILGG